MYNLNELQLFSTETAQEYICSWREDTKESILSSKLTGENLKCDFDESGWPSIHFDNIFAFFKKADKAGYSPESKGGILMQKNTTSLDRQILLQGRRQKRLRIMAKLGIFLFFALCYLSYSDLVNTTISILAVLLLFLFTVPYLIVCVVLFFLSIDSTVPVEKVLKNDIIPRLLREVLGECTYNWNGRIPNDLVRATRPFPADYTDGIDGNDLITGKYKGLDYMLSDIRTWSIHHKSNGESYTIERFCGQWMVLKTNIHPDSPVYVLERSAEEGFVPAEPVVMESIDFNKRFQLAGDPLEVFKIITPQMMEKLLEADKADNGAVTRIKYLPDGTVSITLHTGRDFFELGERAYRNEQELREHMFSEIQQIFSVVDALELWN